MEKPEQGWCIQQCLGAVCASRVLQCSSLLKHALSFCMQHGYLHVLSLGWSRVQSFMLARIKTELFLILSRQVTLSPEVLRVPSICVYIFIYIYLYFPGHASIYMDFYLASLLYKSYICCPKKRQYCWQCDLKNCGGTLGMACAVEKQIRCSSVSWGSLIRAGTLGGSCSFPSPTV